MQFQTASLLLGAALVAIPIVLHLVMRQQPKQLVFPALRFLKQRKESNRRRLRLKHLLLLALRCGAIALAALALARPRVASALWGNWAALAMLGAALLVALVLSGAAATQRRTWPLAGGLGALALVLMGIFSVLLVQTIRRDEAVMLGDTEAPVAAALVVDTSPRMTYRHNNQTRIEAAQDVAEWLLRRQLPAESDVAVLDSRAGATVFAVDLGAAQRAIANLKPTNVPLPLAQRILEALDLVRSSDKSRREIYIFTDLTAAAWNADATGRLRGRLAEAKDVQLYAIDVGVEQPQNFALGDVRLSAESLAQSSTLTVQTEVVRLGPAGARAIELYLEAPDSPLPIIVDGRLALPEMRLRSRQSVDVPADGSVLASFSLRVPEQGVHHGRVEMVGADGLPLDDVRHFTIEVNEAWPVLLAAGRGADASLLAEALAPYEFRESGQARFRVETAALENLGDRELASYAAVVLLDPGPLPELVWRQLSGYVREGGAVAILLGRNATTEGMNTPAALELLPGPLARQWRSGGRDWYLAPRDYQHPMLAAFRPIATSTPWPAFPVFRHWSFERLAADATAVIELSNGKPAMLDRPLGRGRVVVMTTPLSDAANIPGRPPWNQLPTGLNAWPFVILSNEMMLYLVQSGDARLNYFAGQTAILQRRSQTDPDAYLLFTPQGDAPQQILADGSAVTVRFTDAPGAYRLRPMQPGHAMRGFSVNLPLAASDLRRGGREQLDAVLGEGRYQFAQSRDEINREVGQARTGREFYPLLIGLLALFLAMEYLLANRFYRKEEPQA